MTTQPNATFPIPDIIDPSETICIQMIVPKNRQHLSTLMGQLYQLTLWNAWDRDDAHSGKQLAAVWSRALATLKFSCSQTQINGIMEDLEMPLRVDCNCNVFITCCDGTEKQILTADQVKALIVGGSVQGAPQTTPGTCQSYHGTTDANGRFLIPTPVSTGDTLQLSNVVGASSIDGFLNWFCTNGQAFFGGACVGVVHTSTSNPLPSAPTGSLLVLLNSVYYALGTTLFTVPAGIVNQQPVLVLNLPLGVPIYGNVTFDVAVCNHQAGSFTHTIDFTLSNGSFVLAGPGAPQNDPQQGVWTAGNGWGTTDGPINNEGDYYRRVGIQRAIPSTFINTVQLFFDQTRGVTSSPATPCVLDTVNCVTPYSAAVDGAGQSVACTLNSNQTLIYLGLIPSRASSLGALTGSARITKAVITGTGVDPF